MGVDFYACDYCEETFCDCGEYVVCDCGNRWCGENCASEEGYIEEDDNFNGESSCNYCRKEDFSNDDLLEKALDLLNISREELVNKMK